MDKLKWFKFSPSDWVMGRVQRCSGQAQADFIRLCCIYWNKEGAFLDSDARLEVPESSYKELSDFKIFTVVDEMIRIAFLDEQLSELTDLSETKRKAAHARWSKCNASAMQVHDSAMPKEKKRGDKKRKEENRGKSSVPTESEVRAYAQDNGYNPTFMWEKMRGYIDNDMEDSYGNPIKNWKLKLNQVWFKPEHKISNSHTQLVR